MSSKNATNSVLDGITEMQMCDTVLFFSLLSSVVIRKKKNHVRKNSYNGELGEHFCYFMVPLIAKPQW